MPELSNALVWFRRDLRTRDHAALYHALHAAKRVHCLFVFDSGLLAPLPRDDRRVAFIHQSVARLAATLADAGSALWVAHGDPAAIVPAVARAVAADALFFNHDYEPAAQARDDHIAAVLAASACPVRTFKDQAIFDKNEILTGAGQPYSVFTPYKRAWLRLAQDDQAFAAYACETYFDRLAPAPARTPALPDIDAPVSATRLLSLDELGFATAVSPTPGGEDAALARLEAFEPRIDDYANTRDFPALAATSTLSVHLRHGTLSARALARTAYAAAQSARAREGADTWLSELIWRDFFFQVLYHHPRLADAARPSFKPDYDRITWAQGATAEASFDAWCDACTGYPLVDAAMRQINETGFMHNRLRMVVATFLCKDLGVDWRRGEAYFAAQLNDFDLSANNGNWQWASSSGCDAQPWFRIFNPLTQSRKFDARGDFIRKMVPELARLDDTFIHAPWLAPAEVLSRAGVTLGEDYPRPLVDHDAARRRTLERYGAIRAGR